MGQYDQKPSGNRTRPDVSGAFRRNFCRVRFGRRVKRPGVSHYVLDRETGNLVEGTARKADAKNLRSLTLGVSNPADAKERLGIYQERGISGVRFDLRTGEAIFPDRATQLRVARVHGMEVD